MYSPALPYYNLIDSVSIQVQVSTYGTLQNDPSIILELGCKHEKFNGPFTSLDITRRKEELTKLATDLFPDIGSNWVGTSK